MPLVRLIRKLEAEVLDAGLRDRRLEAAQLRAPDRAEIAAQRAIQVHAVAIEVLDVADERRARASLEVLHRPAVLGVEMEGERVVRRVGLENLDALPDAQ